MQLVKYSALLFLPGGNAAAGITVAVMLDGSNQSALLFTDAAGSTAKPNPVTTDMNGITEFYAAPGIYIVDIAGEPSRIPIDFSETQVVVPNLWIHEQGSAASTWTVNHKFGIQPEVQIFTGDGAVADATVTHPSTTQTVITFATPQTGVAHLRR